MSDAKVRCVLSIHPTSMFMKLSLDGKTVHILGFDVVVCWNLFETDI